MVSFENAVNFDVGVLPYSIAVGDFDGDGNGDNQGMDTKILEFNVSIDD